MAPGLARASPLAMRELAEQGPAGGPSREVLESPLTETTWQRAQARLTWTVEVA